MIIQGGNKVKKIKRIVSFTIIGALAVLGLAQSVEAADSDAIIEFIPAGDDTPAPPVLDPTDPEEEYDYESEVPGDPQDEPTGETGPLTLDYVSSINFGENPIEGGNVTYESTTLRPFIQVTDRRGTGEGWNVTAQAASFSTEIDENTRENTLPGSFITFNNGDVISPSTLETLEAPVLQEPIELIMGGEASEVVTAAPNTGLGSWITRWFPTNETGTNNNVTLEVPAGAATTGTHTATITWTLTSGPEPGQQTEDLSIDQE